MKSHQGTSVWCGFYDKTIKVPHGIMCLLHHIVYNKTQQRLFRTSDLNLKYIGSLHKMGFERTVPVWNSNPLIGLQSNQVLKMFRYLFIMSSIILLASTRYDTHLRCVWISVSYSGINTRIYYGYLGGRHWFCLYIYHPCSRKIAYMA